MSTLQLRSTEIGVEKLTDLSKFTCEQLCQLYNSLNQRKWDRRLGKQPSDPNIFFILMNQISQEIGQKELLKWHWIHNLGKTEEAFLRWYDKEVSNRLFAPWLYK